MFLKPVVKALLVLSLARAAHARVVPGQAEQLEQLEQLEQVVMAGEAEQTEQDEIDTNDLSKSLPISYGKCYHIATDQNEYLGHNQKLLHFGRRRQAGLFQVCKHKSSCTPNQSNKVVQEGEEFILYDINGHEKRFVVSQGVFMRPHLSWVNNVIKFWGRKECFGDDCAVRLRAKDERWSFDGLNVNPFDYIYHTNDQSALVLDFKEARCPS